MIENLADLVPEWMLLSAALGFLVGEVSGNNAHHRKCLEQTNQELRDQLEKIHIGREPVDRAIKEQRGVINDIHNRILAVQKGLEKRPS